MIVAGKLARRENLLGGPSSKDIVMVEGRPHAVTGDRNVEDTSLKMTGFGLRERRGAADAQQESVTEAEKSGIEVAIAATLAGRESKAPGASGAYALFEAQGGGGANKLSSWSIMVKSFILAGIYKFPSASLKPQRGAFKDTSDRTSLLRKSPFPPSRNLVSTTCCSTFWWSCTLFGNSVSKIFKTF